MVRDSQRNKEERIPPSLSLHFVWTHRLNFVHCAAAAFRCWSVHTKKRKEKWRSHFFLFTLCVPPWLNEVHRLLAAADCWSGWTTKWRERGAASRAAKGTYYFLFLSDAKIDHRSPQSGHILCGSWLIRKRKKKISRTFLSSFFLTSHYIFILLEMAGKERRRNRNYVRVCGS